MPAVRSINRTRKLTPRVLARLCACIAASVTSSPPARADAAPEPPSSRPDIHLYRIAKGFQPEVMDAAGTAAGNGFATPNRWGQYTAYLMTTSRNGERTWRIEHYLPYPGQNYAQGSSMYLLEGGKRALLIDTGNPASYTLGVDDLKTVVRYLLSHENDGKVRKRPLDFVVANTHNHGDHIGENRLMIDRIVYYMDGDWPEKAPDNYMPIREDGGPTAHGKGQAVGTIDLGGRVLRAIAVPPHTNGSTAYLDAANRMLFTGDALGSAWPWLQFAPMSIYAQTLKRLEAVTRPYPDLMVFPAHFYQVRSWGRSGPLLNGRPLDRQYIADQKAIADGLLGNTVIGEPYPWQHSAFWAQVGSARAVYSLYQLGRPGEALASNYFAARISGNFPREWTLTTPPPAQDINRLSDIGSQIFIIRQQDGPSLYLVRGSQAALLIGTGTGKPGLATLVAKITEGLPLDIAVMDASEEQAGGLAQFSPRKVYVPQGQDKGTALPNGAALSLGTDERGRPLILEAQNLTVSGKSMLTLRLVADRLMFTGRALGRVSLPQEVRSGAIAPFQVADPLNFQIGLTEWSARTIGRYDSLLGSGSADWYLSPEYVTQLEQVLTKANTGRGEATAEPASQPGMTLFRSSGPADIKALIFAPAHALPLTAR